MYETIKHETKLSLRTSCQCLSVSRPAYENWLSQQPYSKQDADKELLRHIRSIASEFAGYGYRRITVELHRQYIVVNHKKVLKTMKKHGLLAKQKKRFKPKTTDS